MPLSMNVLLSLERIVSLMLQDHGAKILLPLYSLTVRLGTDFKVVWTTVTVIVEMAGAVHCAKLLSSMFVSLSKRVLLYTLANKKTALPRSLWI